MSCNGQDAITKTKLLAPDLIILNLSMPVLDGLQTTTRDRKSIPGVKILVFTMDDAVELRRETFRRGAHGYVSKSSALPELIEEVKKLLA
jgi:two-component system, NarL family, nitrate/nitrite response regulator NarL